MKTLAILPQKLPGLLGSLFFLFILLACERATERSDQAINSAGVEMAPQADFAEQAEESKTAETTAQANENNQLAARFKVIRNASLRFQVDNYPESLRNIETLIKRYQGIIVNSNETRVNNSLQNSIVIRVPAKNLDDLVEELAKQAIFLDYKNISSEDVSTEFVDVSARLKAKQVVEQRYLDLLKQAKNIKEILEIENQLRQIREEIESAQARLNYINSQVAFSTVNLEIYETRSPLADNNNFGIRLLNALKSGWDMLLNLIIGLLHLWPLLLLIPLVIYGVRWLKRH